jgi:hypothetical protein
LFFYYNISQAQRIALYDSVPSTNELYKLQYCLDDSDCQIVQWQDCNQCPYSRSMNKHFSGYFYDNADYYNYPIGFNRHYCDTLATIAAQAKGTTAGADLIVPKVSCEDTRADKESAVSSKCDPVIKQCYSVCSDGHGGTHKCSYDHYSQKFYDAYLAPVIDPVGTKTIQ